MFTAWKWCMSNVHVYMMFYNLVHMSNYNTPRSITHNTPPLPWQHVHMTYNMGMHGCGMTIYGHVVMAMEGYYMTTPV
jgi:hypothetical protein